LIYEEYYADGQLEYFEENHKSFEYYITTKSHYSNGVLETLLELTNPKKVTFQKTEYYENGNVREQGALFFNKNNLDYYKSGKWSYFEDTGKLSYETFYENGKSIKTVNH
jgi:antitoxin component YwqK of YwqJK toxin-antitoxin module